jgi:urocanate hydratase
MMRSGGILKASIMNGRERLESVGVGSSNREIERKRLRPRRL